MRGMRRMLRYLVRLVGSTVEDWVLALMMMAAIALIVLGVRNCDHYSSRGRNVAAPDRAVHGVRVRAASQSRGRRVRAAGRRTAHRIAATSGGRELRGSRGDRQLQLLLLSTQTRADDRRPRKLDRARDLSSDVA